MDIEAAEKAEKSAEDRAWYGNLKADPARYRAYLDKKNAWTKANRARIREYERKRQAQPEVRERKREVGRASYQRSKAEKVAERKTDIMEWWEELTITERAAALRAIEDASFIRRHAELKEALKL